MKKIITLVFTWGLAFGLFAQNPSPPYSMGWVGTQSTPVEGMRVTISSGALVSTQWVDGLDGKVMAGFHPSIIFLNNTFSQNLFASKGYFGGYVELSWDVTNNESDITGFRIFRKKYLSGEDSVLVAALAGNVRSWQDHYSESGQLYEYTLYAQGISNDFIFEYVNYIKGIGFRVPTATVSGRVTYEGGVAVEGVKILAETDDEFGAYSIFLNGENAFISVPDNINNSLFDLDTAFTFKSWVRPDQAANGSVIFSKGEQYVVEYESGRINFYVEGQQLSLDFTEKVDTFFHVAATYSQVREKATLHVMYREEEVWTAQADIVADPQANGESVFLGRSADGNFFRGYFADFRMYRRALSHGEIMNSFGRFIAGSESHIVAYLRLNEGAGNLIFDLARAGFNFYENHGSITNGEWSELTPTSDQLSFKGITNSAGNYLISGIPYATDGSVYYITPMYLNHQFEPDHTLLFLSNNSATHNNINFTDISSFRVSGNIKYNNTRFPVEGVSFKIDGSAVVNASGGLVTTDAMGNFEISVPIGHHYITVEKQGHEFENGGRFPPEPNTTFDFQQPLSGLQFIDVTLVKVMGRVAGGPLEAEKPTGLGQTFNNLGNAQITLTTQKQRDLSDNDDEPVTGTWEQWMYKGGEPEQVGETSYHINHLNPRNITIFPDTETGEFVAYLLPERYVITQASAGNYTFGESFHTMVDLTGKFMMLSETDTIAEFVIIDGEPVETFRIDSVSFQHHHDLIYRVSPSISVTRPNGDPVFWETQAMAKDDNIVDLVDEDGNLKTLYPVLMQRGNYRLKVSVFEEYINADNDNYEDRVPVTDGQVQIQNQLAIDTRNNSYPIAEDGTVLYEFTGGLPNITTGGIGDYLLTMAIVARTGPNNAISTPWLFNGQTFRAYLLGGMPTGNNFVTTGPNQIITILRDPPGDESFASLEQGQTIVSTSSFDFGFKVAQATNVNFDLGTRVVTFAGIGAGVITENETVANFDIGFETSLGFVDNQTQTSTTTVTQTWSTSSEPDFVGSGGDVFVGKATNIVYGVSTQIDLMPIDLLEGDGFVGGEFEQEGVIYDIGMTKGIRVSPEIATTFAFSQNNIENYLLPNLAMLRNSFLLSHDAYQCVICDPNDPEFGRPNTTGIYVPDGYIGGDSYNVTIPLDWPSDSTFVDSVDFFNRQLADWIRILSDNEKEKLEAELIENISFDGGASYTSSETFESSTEETFTFEWDLDVKVAAEVGFSLLGMGTRVQTSRTMSFSVVTETGETLTNNTTYSYTLSDSNAGDYISVDVKKPKSPYGLVFSIVGGQTMCPHEDAEYTKYYMPGTLLGQATMQREIPQLTVENPIVTNVPEDAPAIFNFQLANISESQDDQWFMLIVDEASNQNGAKISMDGNSIGNGRAVLVPAGQTLNKIISVEKVQPDVYDYEGLTLILHSMCQFDPTNFQENIADSVSISAYFQPVCSSIKLNQPNDLWVINTITGTEMAVNFDAYNLNHSTFERILFQYKPSSSSLWLTEMSFFVYEEDYNGAPEPKTFIGGQPVINYIWDMSALIDRSYDVRVTTICTDGTVNHSQVKSGIKDTHRPQVFGTPQPANGILSHGDDVMISFNEPIVGALLTPYNFSVRGVLNGYELNHNTSLFFDGSTSYASVRRGVYIKDESFTIEFWLNRATDGRAVVLSQSHDLEIGFTETNKFYLRLGDQEIVTVDEYPQTDTWVHWGVVYNAETQLVTFLKDDGRALENVAVTGTFEASGDLILGKSFDHEHFLHGAMHELRVWNKTLSLSLFYINSMRSFVGSEIGLIGYWPMKEANGNRALDLSRAQHATLFGTTWQVLPLKYSRYFNGDGDHLLINTAASVIIIPQMDFTIEFWFRGQPQANTTLFSNGIGDGTDQIPSVLNALSIGFNDQGQLFVQNNGTAVTAPHDFLDNNWHHVAVVMNRQANFSLFVNGQLQAYAPAAGFTAMAGAQMAIGARRYMAGQDWVVDNHFEGYIDEFRVWGLARRRGQMDIDRNSKIHGDEMGLLAYYPFEQYEETMGIMILQPTLDDNYIPPFDGWQNGGTATAIGGEFSQETPTIRDARPVENLQFSWVASQNQIVIHVEEPPAAIEKTILDFTVANVEDLHENRMASPVTWSAFVKQNTVLWDRDRINFEKELYAPLTFQAKIRNVAGVEQSYNISNLPIWLTTSQPQGNLPPDSYSIVEFTVNPALNIGNYVVSLYLTSDFGYHEKLDLYLKVYKEAPHWVVDPADFQFSANIVGQLLIDSLYSSNEDNIIAVFHEGELRGAGKLKYVEAFDSYLVFLDLYSNQELGETMHFRVWDAARGQVITLVLPELEFAANTLYGSPSAPLQIYAYSYYEGKIPLNAGWTWISFNLDSPHLNDLPVLFKDVELQNNDIIKGQFGFDQYASQSQSWHGNLTSSDGINTQQMYMVRIGQRDTLIYEGPAADVTIPIQMEQGWNWIGYTPQVSMDVAEAFASFHPKQDDLVKSQQQFAVFDQHLGWVGSLTMMQPGRGYMYNATQAGELVYPPQSAMSKSDEVPLVSDDDIPWNFDPGLFSSTMSLMATVFTNDYPDDTPYILGAFANGICRGIAQGVAVEGSIMYFLSIAGEHDGENIQFLLFHPEKGEVFSVNEKLVFVADQITGNLISPFVLNMGAVVTGTTDLPGMGAMVSAFPNPFSNELHIVFDAELDHDTQVFISDVTGRVIYRFDKTALAGRKHIVWNGMSASGAATGPGVYIVTVQGRHRVESVPVVKH